MAEGKGGVYGSFVMVRLKKGNSKRYANDPAKAKTSKAKVTGEGYGNSDKCPIVYIKDPIAKFFGFEIINPMDMVRLMTKEVETTINGKTEKINKLVSMGATGASRSVTVRFKKLENIGGKKVASVNIAMPSSHRYSDMLQELMIGPKANLIAQVVSPAGKAMTFQAAYSPKKAANRAAAKK
jgi:hypothetical protein